MVSSTLMFPWLKLNTRPFQNSLPIIYSNSRQRGQQQNGKTKLMMSRKISWPDLHLFIDLRRNIYPFVSHYNLLCGKIPILWQLNIIVLQTTAEKMMQENVSYILLFSFQLSISFHVCLSVHTSCCLKRFLSISYDIELILMTTAW